MKKNIRQFLRALCEGAIMLALAQVLGYLKLWQFPQGGSVNLGMLPIFLYCVRWGFGPGMLVSFGYGLLQLLLDGAYAWGWQSILGDYLLAYGVLGVAGVFSKRKLGFFWGVITGSLLRFLVHWVVGATVWAEYMPENFFGMTMTSPWIYSALYNGSFIAVNMTLILVVGVILYRYMGKHMGSQRQ